MKNKFKNIFLIGLASAVTFFACQDELATGDLNVKGTGAAMPVITVSGNITSTQNWTNGNVYLIEDEVRVVSGVTLDIQEGTIIKGKKSPTDDPDDSTFINSVLVIMPGAKIEAEGSASQPIVFTSDQAAGSRAPGDWGGVVILGNAPVNQTNPQIEGLQNPPTFGGTNATDNSGTFSYCRIEFSGTVLTDGDETNGLTLGGVGSGTSIHHVQVSAGNDDGYEFFGGTVSAKYLVSWQSRDDDFDTDFGHSGVLQYVVSSRKNDFVSTESHAVESDNDGSGSSNTPKTGTFLVNATLIGPGDDCGDGTEIDLTPAGGYFESAALIRRNSSLSILNTISGGWPTGLIVRDQLTQSNYSSSFATINSYESLSLGGITQAFQNASSADIIPQNPTNSLVTTKFARPVFANAAGLSNPSGGSCLSNLLGLSSLAFSRGASPDFTPVTGAAILNNAVTLPTAAISAGAVQEAYRGAFDASASGWDFSSGWLNFDPQNAVYD